MTLRETPVALGEQPGPKKSKLADPIIAQLASNLIAIEARLIVHSSGSRAIELIAQARAALAAEIGRAVAA